MSDEDILACARMLFIERGYSVRTQQIAAAVGLTWGAIALRFPSKRALFEQAMAAPVLPPDALAGGPAASLPGLLAQLRNQLWERWPRRLQRQIAAPAAGSSDDPDGWLPQLAAAFEAQARRGTIRADMSPAALARLVLAVMTGDVAQRYVAGRPPGSADPAIVDDLVRLLTGAVGAAREPEVDHAG